MSGPPTVPEAEVKMTGLALDQVTAPLLSE